MSGKSTLLLCLIALLTLQVLPVAESSLAVTQADMLVVNRKLERHIQHIKYQALTTRLTLRRTFNQL